MSSRDKVQINNSKTVFEKKTYSGLNTAFLDIKSGSRIVFSFYVFTIDVGAEVTTRLKTGFSEEAPFGEALSLSSSTVGLKSAIISDFHNFIDVELEVTGGNAEVIVGLNVFDNALSTRIDNAEIAADLNHTIQQNGQYDSVRVGNGLNELKVYTDGSLDFSAVEARYKGAPLVNGVNDSMDVDGSVVPVEYIYAPQPGEILHIESIGFYMSDSSRFTDSGFGGIPSPLDNGLLFEMKSKGNIYQQANLTKNNNIFALFNFGKLYLEKQAISGSEYVFTASVKPFYRMTLDGNQGDYMKVIVRDNLTPLNTLTVTLILWERNL